MKQFILTVLVFIPIAVSVMCFILEEKYPETKEEAEHAKRMHFYGVVSFFVYVGIAIGIGLSFF